MKSFLRRLACLALAAALLLSAVPAAASAEAPAGGQTLLLQAGGTGAVLDGELQAVPPSRYAANGALLVPLRAVAEAMGAAVDWEAAAKTAVVTREERTLRVPAGSWTAWADGQPVTLPTPAETADGVLYVPLLALEALGLWVHTFGYYEGGYQVIAAESRDEAGLAALRETAEALLGPNAGLFDSKALLLRSGSRWAVRAGTEEALCGEDADGGPYTADDGVVMLPLAYCAEALGCTVTEGGDGRVTVTRNGRTAVFPGTDGTVTVDGAVVEHPYLRGCVRDGAAYCSLYAFSTALGIYGYADGATGALVLSPWDLAGHDDLRLRGLGRAAELRTLEEERVRGYIALTFDDGPSGQYTARLLDGLQARGVHATFFLCNYRIQAYSYLMPRYAAEGHELASHSATHATLTACSPANLAAELDVTSAALQAATGTAPTLMRPPGGAYNGPVLRALQARGLSCILWNVDPQDWLLRDRQKVVDAVLSSVGDGDIVLLHDMSDASVDAALEIIDTLQARGYRFVTVSELAARKGVTLEPGKVYRGF